MWKGVVYAKNEFCHFGTKFRLKKVAFYTPNLYNHVEEVSIFLLIGNVKCVIHMQAKNKNYWSMS